MIHVDALLNDINDRLTRAEELAIQAGKLILNHRDRRPETKNLLLREIVTAADRASEQLIVTGLQAYFPNDAVLGEEFGHREGSSGFSWVIDPLDGTTNYAMHIPIFCVSIAVLYKNQPLAGVVYNPNQDTLYEATYKGGAFSQGKPLQVSNTAFSPNALMGFSSRFVGTIPPYLVRVLEYLNEYRNTGSATLHLCYVASGFMDGAFSHSTKLWDIAAAALILIEAGGKVTDFHGRPLFPLSHPLPVYFERRLPFVASNGKLTAEMTEPLFGDYEPNV